MKYYETIICDFVELNAFYNREVKMKLVFLTDDSQSLKLKISGILSSIN